MLLVMVVVVDGHFVRSDQDQDSFNSLVDGRALGVEGVMLVVVVYSGVVLFGSQGTGSHTHRVWLEVMERYPERFTFRHCCLTSGREKKRSHQTHRAVLTSIGDHAIFILLIHAVLEHLSNLIVVQFLSCNRNKQQIS